MQTPIVRTLIKGQAVYAPGYPDADALLIVEDTIEWVGQYSAINHLGLQFDRIIDASDLFIAPAFVDSHVHLSATGALLTGLDLRETKSAKQAIEELKAFVSKNDAQFIIGHGWEDTSWPDRQLWSYDSVSEIVGNRNLYLSRIDVHSALVFTPTHRGIVKTDQHHQVRKFVQDELPQAQRRDQIRAALNLAAANGVASVHENGGPAVSGSADFQDVLDIAATELVPKVFGYWGSTDLTEVKNLNAFGAAGDLTIDGSIGSRTAWLVDPYCGEHLHGTAFLSENEIAAHLIACTEAKIQGGFHAIGDGALDAFMAGLLQAASVLGDDQIRRARHRIEHAEMLSEKHLQDLARLGVVLSMQPVFDELWGNANGLYEERLGIERAQHMNTFSKIAASGISMAFSSDSPVTPIDPWRAINAAVNHHTSEHRISARAAFMAHTRGGWRAVKEDNAGMITEGAPAHLAFWEVKDYDIKIPDDRIRSWSTDIRSGTPALPDLASHQPKCIATILNGKAIFDPNQIWKND